jgi:hypothetical protein
MGQKWYQSTAYDLPISHLVVFQRLNKLLREACFVNVTSIANCLVAERYIHYTCDHGMWRYGITVIADVALRCKLNRSRTGFLTGFAEECVMNCNRDTVAPHSAITGIAESYKIVKFAAERHIPGSLFWWLLGE